MGYLPARTHGWDATMSEYDRQCEVYEYGYHVGHKALFSFGQASRSSARRATAVCTSTWRSIRTGTV